MHNAAAVSHLFVPIESSFLMSLAGIRVWRLSIVLEAILVLVSFGATQASAQVKTPKRVTSVRAAKAPDGSKVTVVSNSALSDYEAYRRGDRFYVKVPQAGLGAARPKLRGHGFDDVQVQKTDDDLIFSFRLQPGTAARVNQTQNRLDVVFATSPKSSNAATPRPATAANASADPANPSPPAATQAPRKARGPSDVRERNTSINSNSKERTANSALSTEVLSTLEASNTPASTSPSTPTGSQTSVSDKGLLARWSVRRSLWVLGGLLVLGGVALLLRRYNRKDTGRQVTELIITPTVVNDRVSEASLANPASLEAAPTGVALSSAATCEDSSEMENDPAEEEASLLRQEQALRREAEALVAKQLAAEKVRKEFEASAELRAKPVEHGSLEVTSDLELMALLQEENRYRTGAETLRKAAEELARMRLAAEAVRKAAEQKATDNAEDKKLPGIADLEMCAKKTASHY